MVEMGAKGGEREWMPQWEDEAGVITSFVCSATKILYSPGLRNADTPRSPLVQRRNDYSASNRWEQREARRGCNARPGQEAPTSCSRSPGDSGF